MPSGSGRDHFAGWHTGDGVATDLRGELTPLVHNLIHNPIVLAIHTLSSLAAAFLAEIHDGVLGCLNSVDLNAIVRVGHRWFPLITL